jgi:hypothetical protein
MIGIVQAKFLPISGRIVKRHKVVVENGVECPEQQQDIYQPGAHFNFIKMHLVSHYTAHIRQFGNIPAYSKEVAQASY